jgi:antitoxin ParD1/3/4
MTTVNIAFPDALKAFIDEQVAARGYASASDYLTDLVRREQEVHRFRGLIQEGLDSGPGEIVDDAWLDALRAEIGNPGAA